MNTTPSFAAHGNLVLLAQMLDRLERSGQRVDADQFRTVAARLAAELDTVPHDAALESVLHAFPAAAEIYENLNYEHAGLCRCALDTALATELAARAAIDIAKRGTTQD
jgi:methyl coenzyme M reductase alpha subunit